MTILEKILSLFSFSEHEAIKRVEHKTDDLERRTAKLEGRADALRLLIESMRDPKSWGKSR